MSLLLLGVVYHPRDELLLTSLKQNVDRLNKHSSLSQPIKVVSFKTHSGKILSYVKQSHLGARIFSIARYRNRIRPIMMPEANADNEVEIQRALSVLLRTSSRNVILVCEPQDARSIIERAMRSGCMYQDSKWLIVDMELTGNISALAYRGLVGLRVFYDYQHKLKREAERLTRNARSKKISMASYAVLNDSIQAVTEAIKQIKQITFDNRGKDECPIKGALDDRGQSVFINNLMTVRFQGLTGPVEFNAETRDRVTKLIDIVNIQTRFGFPPSFMYPSSTGGSHGTNPRDQPSGPTLGTNPRDQPSGPTLGTNPRRDQPSGPTLGTNPRDQPSVATLGTNPRRDQPSGPTLGTNPRDQPSSGPTLGTNPRDQPSGPTLGTNPRRDQPSGPTLGTNPRDQPSFGYWKANDDSPVGSVVLKTNDAVFWNGYYWEEIKCSFSKLVATKDFVRHHRPLIVTSILDSPYMELKKNQTNLKGNDRYQGFGFDMIKVLAERLMFKYQIVISKETSYGAPIGGEWKGLVGELINQNADIAVGPITITAEREEVIDFSKPFLDFRIAMILTKPKGEEVNLFAFLLPFEEQLWLCVCAIVGTVTVIMYILDRFSPYGYRAEAKETGEGDGNEFGLSNSLWFATGSILQQGADTTPKAGSGRVLAASFWLFTLILISTYTANLAAYFTAKNTKSSINSLEDLVGQEKVRYGVLNGGSLYTFFENSKVRTYKKMFGKMKTLNTFVGSTSIGVNISRQGDFAYLTDQPSLDYYNQRKPCNTMLVKNLLDAKSYAIGLQKNSEWTNKLPSPPLSHYRIQLIDNQKLQVNYRDHFVPFKLREEGEIEKMRLRWWDDRSECPPSSATDSAPTRLALHHLAGVFIILGGGAAISLALLFVESRCQSVMGGERTKNPKNPRDDSDGRTRHTSPAITLNGGTALKPLNNSERRSPRQDSPANRRTSYDVRIPDVYATAPESNL
ncbi:hypothetical protein QZH41_013283 [Actinostola sp. cb2023]|nr:hypothetical protein QZH41_013283 [Actinostola sp. cb2023]